MPFRPAPSVWESGTGPVGRYEIVELTFRRWERAGRNGNAAADAVAGMVRKLTFRRRDDFAGKPHTFRRRNDFAGKPHTFRRWGKAGRNGNAATDAVAGMARKLTFRRRNDFAEILLTFGRWERAGIGMAGMKNPGCRRCGGRGLLVLRDRSSRWG